jgi:hypothetical protein
MPLLDPFRPPLSTQRHWESFHTTWASALADSLNEVWLPEGYFAEEQLHPSARVEIDVATFEEGRASSAGGAATAVAGRKIWSPPAPAWTIPAVFPEGLEVLVYHSEGGPSLVGAVELISPGNKDRPETRRAFAIKCASYLNRGIGLVIVDVVTSRLANLHNETMRLLDRPAENQLADSGALYAVAYRPLRRGEEDQIDIWPQELAIGKTMPDMPLALGAGLVVPVTLEAAYDDACRRRRL